MVERLSRGLGPAEKENGVLMSYVVFLKLNSLKFSKPVFQRTGNSANQDRFYGSFILLTPCQPFGKQIQILISRIACK